MFLVIVLDVLVNEIRKETEVATMYWKKERHVTLFTGDIIVCFRLAKGARWRTRH